MGAAQLPDRMTASTTSGRVMKGELVLQLSFSFVYLRCRNCKASACCVLESHNECDRYDVAVVKGWRGSKTLSKAVSSILAELHVHIRVLLLVLLLN